MKICAQRKQKRADGEEQPLQPQKNDMFAIYLLSAANPSEAMVFLKRALRPPKSGDDAKQSIETVEKAVKTRKESRKNHRQCRDSTKKEEKERKKGAKM